MGVASTPLVRPRVNKCRLLDMYQKVQLHAFACSGLFCLQPGKPKTTRSQTEESAILMTNLQEEHMYIYWETKLESEQF